ncbi:MAG: response regulator transcription factor [Aquabacterium sp.]
MKRILITEDQPDIRKLIHMTLEFEDYEIREAPDGVEGLRVAKEFQPDLMLLDVMMPGELDGLQVCRHVKADPALRHIKVVILSARGQVADRQAGKEAGADGYLIKPFSPLELIETLESMLATA